MAIYSRDNFAPALQSALDSALRRRDEYVKRDAARRDANVKAITDFMEGVAYAADDDLDEREKKLLAEKAAAQKAQNDALDESMMRSSEALDERKRNEYMLGGGPKTGITPSGTLSNGPGIAYEQAMGMRGYIPNGYRVPDFGNDMYKRRVGYEQPNYTYQDYLLGIGKTGVY